MHKLFKKSVADMDDIESKYFQMEVQSAFSNVIRQHSSKGGQFLLALSVALRDEAGRQLYKNGGNNAAKEMEVNDVRN